MSDNLGMAAQLAGQSVRFGWYFALNRLVDWRTDQLGKTRRYKPSRPVPSRKALGREHLPCTDQLNKLRRRFDLRLLCRRAGRKMSARAVVQSSGSLARCLPADFRLSIRLVGIEHLP